MVQYNAIAVFENAEDFREGTRYIEPKGIKPYRTLWGIDVKEPEFYTYPLYLEYNWSMGGDYITVVDKERALEMIEAIERNYEKKLAEAKRDKAKVMGLE